MSIVPPKSRNDVWRELDIEPFESFVRTRIGKLLSPDRLDEAPAMIRDLLADPEEIPRTGRTAAKGLGFQLR